MSDILIRGMEMPTRCGRCDMCVPEADGDTDWHNVCCITEADIVDVGEKMVDCPLVPVPAHGRLIDADEMKESVRKQTAFLRLIGGEFAEIAEMLENCFMQEIDNAPTIIPAEDGET